MPRAPRALLGLVLLLMAARQAHSQEVIYIVRHAERADQSADSALSSQGISRAERLRDLLRDAGITQIYTSELQRTIATAAPLAAARHLTSRPIAAADTAALAARISAAGPQDRVLVVGHSNTVPAVLRALNVDAPIAIADTDYDNLFIVVPKKDGRPVLLRLKY